MWPRLGLSAWGWGGDRALALGLLGGRLRCRALVLGVEHLGEVVGDDDLLVEILLVVLTLTVAGLVAGRGHVLTGVVRAWRCVAEVRGAGEGRIEEVEGAAFARSVQLVRGHPRGEGTLDGRKLLFVRRFGRPVAFGLREGGAHRGLVTRGAAEEKPLGSLGAFVAGGLLFNRDLRGRIFFWFRSKRSAQARGRARPCGPPTCRRARVQAAPTG